MDLHVNVRLFFTALPYLTCIHLFNSFSHDALETLSIIPTNFTGVFFYSEQGFYMLYSRHLHVPVYQKMIKGMKKKINISNNQQMRSRTIQCLPLIGKVPHLYGYLLV